MKNKHQIYLVSDSTGETLDRMFLAVKAQFENFIYETHNYSFTRTENQINKILDKAENIFRLMKFTVPYQVKVLYQILTKEERLKFIGIASLSIVSSLVAMLGIVSVVPFLAMATQPELVQSNFYFKMVYDYLNFTNTPTHLEEFSNVNTKYQNDTQVDAAIIAKVKKTYYAFISNNNKKT